jgi:hypothetical protein
MRKNVNPKSLKGRDQLDRVRELMGKMQPLNENTSLSELELIKKGPNNVIYGVVRENHKYFIKTANKTSGKIVAEDFDYIGGLQNKFSEAYDSYASATKQLNLKFDMLNESLGINTHTNILESDGVRAGFGFVVEEEEIEEEVVEEAEIEEGNEFTGALAKAKEEGKDEFEVDGKKYKVEEAESKLDEEKEMEEQKKVLKVDTPAPAEPAMEEPVEDEVDDFGGEEMDMEEPAMDMEEPAMDDEGDDEEDSTKKIQKLTGKIGQAIRELDEPDAELEKYVINSIISALHLDQFSDEDIEDIISKLEGEDEEDDAEASDSGELDMEEPSMEEEPAEEVEMEVTEESVVYKKSQLVESLTKKILKESIEEHHMGHSSPGKYDVDAYKIMDEDFDMEMSSMYVDCPECMGSGCNHCDELGYHLANEFDGGDVSDDFMMLNADGEYGPFDRDGDDIPSDIDMDDDGDGVLELGMNEEDMMEDDGYGIDVLDSVSADFDIDGDGIPSKIDNVYGDSEGLNDLDLDIEFFNEPGIAPSKPGTKDPIIKPKTPPKRGPWTKPKTRPNPKAVKEGDDMSKPKRSFRRKGFYK